MSSNGNFFSLLLSEFREINQFSSHHRHSFAFLRLSFSTSIFFPSSNLVKRVCVFMMCKQSKAREKKLLIFQSAVQRKLAFQLFCMSQQREVNVVVIHRAWDWKKIILKSLVSQNETIFFLLLRHFIYFHIGIFLSHFSVYSLLCELWLHLVSTYDTSENNKEVKCWKVVNSQQ